MTKKIYFDNIHVDFHGQIREKKRITKYVRNVLHYFMPRLRRNVVIDISFKKGLDGDVYGYCLGDKHNVEIEIFKGNLTLDQMMLTLAHELIHAKQFLKGELSPTCRNWKAHNVVHKPYSRQPWELEAYKKEELIHDMFWVK